MATNPQHSTGVRCTLTDEVTGKITAITGGTAFIVGTNLVLKLYTGTIPATASTALSGNTAASTITAIVWGTTNTGTAVNTVTSSTPDSSAVGGTVTFFRMYRTAAVDTADVILQGTCGTSAADLTLNSTVISAGAAVSLTSGSYTASP